MIGYGTKPNTKSIYIRYAIEKGYKMIDTKNSNKNISYFKEILKGINRENIIICSKLVGFKNPENHRPCNIKKKCLEMLKEAGLEYWDIYYIHTTHSFGNIPILDTYRELIKLKEEGLTKNIGLSNITQQQLETIIINSVKPDYIQIEIHPYLTENRLISFCKENDIKIVAHSPLGSKFRKKIFDEQILIELSKKYNKTISQIILQWHISRGIIPIPSSTNLNHIKQNLNSLFSISEIDLNKITNINKNLRVWIKKNHINNF